MRRFILHGLSRDRLKELCRALDLDDAGRKKADIVARLTAPAGASRSARGDGLPSAPAPAVDTAQPALSDTLSVAQLEQYLWSAADILRGSIDSSDYPERADSVKDLRRSLEYPTGKTGNAIEYGIAIRSRESFEQEFYVAQ